MSTELRGEIISWIKTIIFAVAFALCINNFVIVNASVPTGSMQNTILEGDRILAFRLSYLLADPERYDVVVFKNPDDESILYVKRIIGLPGEVVEIVDGDVYINDNLEPLDNSFTKERCYDNYGPVTVPDGSYFMLGDNRNNSKDSRLWLNTYLKEDKMLGKVIFKYFPVFKMIK